MISNDKYHLPLILFDSECTLCKRFKMALEKIPGLKDYCFISIHDEEIYQYIPEIDKDKCHETLHIIDSEGTIYLGPEAVSFLITQFPVVKKFAWLAETNAGKKTVDIFYNTVNKYRESLLNRCQTCKKNR